MVNPKVIAEIKAIAQENGGLIDPEYVIDRARKTPEGHPFHDYFDWDIMEAAHQHWLHQARQLLRVTVEYLEIQGETLRVRVAVSLSTDRLEEGGGYRLLAAVLRNPDHKQQLLEDALQELKSFERKYCSLQELAGIFQAVKKVRAGRKKESISH